MFGLFVQAIYVTFTAQAGGFSVWQQPMQAPGTVEHNGRPRVFPPIASQSAALTSWQLPSVKQHASWAALCRAARRTTTANAIPIRARIARAVSRRSP